MKHVVWLVVELALMPAFVLFAGLAASAPERSPADFAIIGLFLIAALVAGAMFARSLRDDPPHGGGA